jgi:hypothetical protein
MGQLKVEQSPLTASNDVAFTHDRAYALENGYMGREYVVLKIASLSWSTSGTSKTTAINI